MRIKDYISLIFLFTSFQYSFSQEIFIDTFHYKTINNQKLEFDFYSNKFNSKKKPTILFIHGGSFMSGSKNSSYVKPYAEEWVKNGYNFISINYRLTLKGKSFHCDCSKEDKVKTFEHAVYDLRAVTQHIIDNKKKLGVDVKKIILSGNSAGAEAILHAAYWKNTEHNINEQILNKKFKYAGVLAYAGAIVDTNLITENNAIPTALFHGNCDPYVPYKTATHHYCSDSTVGALMLSGSFDIMKRLEALDKSYYMYTMCQGNHRVNTLGLSLELINTIDFVNHTILKRKKRQIHKVEKTSQEKCNFVEVDFCD